MELLCISGQCLSDMGLLNENYRVRIDPDQLTQEAPEVSKTAQDITIVLDHSPALHGNALLLKSTGKSISP